MKTLEKTLEEASSKAFRKATEMGLVGRERIHYMLENSKKEDEKLREQQDLTTAIPENMNIYCNGLSNTHLFG